MEVICLPKGIIAPEGAEWANLTPMRGGGWVLEGSIADQPGTISRYGDYPSMMDAIDAALEHALGRECELLYVEIDARRC